MIVLKLFNNKTFEKDGYRTENGSLFYGDTELVKLTLMRADVQALTVNLQAEHLDIINQVLKFIAWVKFKVSYSNQFTLESNGVTVELGETVLELDRNRLC